MQTFNAFRVLNPGMEIEEKVLEELYIKGKDDRALCATQTPDQIEVGHDNSGWVYDKPEGQTNYLKPNFLNGSIQFFVDVSDVGCNCAAGVKLVALNDECTQKAYDGS